MKVIIDRFEECFAVVEMQDKSMVDIPIYLIPEGAKEGDILEIRIDEKGTLERKESIEKLMDNLWE